MQAVSQMAEFWAVMPYGGRRYFVFGGNDFGGGGKIKIWR